MFHHVEIRMGNNVFRPVCVDCGWKGERVSTWEEAQVQKHPEA